jgi:hypothetical protein
MLGFRLLCGGKDRGLPPVASGDVPLGVLLAAVAVAVLGAVALGVAIAPLVLLRLLGAPSGVTVAVILAGAGGVAALMRARTAR